MGRSLGLTTANGYPWCYRTNYQESKFTKVKTFILLNLITLVKGADTVKGGGGSKSTTMPGELVIGPEDRLLCEKVARVGGVGWDGVVVGGGGALHLNDLQADHWVGGRGVRVHRRRIPHAALGAALPRPPLLPLAPCDLLQGCQGVGGGLLHAGYGLRVRNERHGHHLQWGGSRVQAKVQGKGKL